MVRAVAIAAVVVSMFCGRVQAFSQHHRRQAVSHERSNDALLGHTRLLSTSGGAADPPSSNNKGLRSFASKNFFLVGMFGSVGIARLFPHLGKSGGILHSLIGNFGVSFIFLLSGLSLELSQLAKAFSNLRLNSLIQLATFGVWPFLIGLPVVHAFKTLAPQLVPLALLDGILILTCLPTTVNMCVILTGSAGGNVAVALSNAVVSNLAGVALTPALLFRFFGSKIQLSFVASFLKLCNKVLVPVALGQLLRFTPIKGVYQRNSKTFKRTQEIILLSILWNAFCNAFTQSMGVGLRHGLILLALLPSIHLVSLAGFFSLFRGLGFPSGDVVAAMFVSSQKTLAFGLPLVSTIFENSPDLAAYCAPIMFIHPLQLIIGSTLLPRLQRYTNKKE